MEVEGAYDAIKSLSNSHDSCHVRGFKSRAEQAKMIVAVLCIRAPLPSVLNAGGFRGKTLCSLNRTLTGGPMCRRVTPYAC